MNVSMILFRQKNTGTKQGVNTEAAHRSQPDVPNLSSLKTCGICSAHFGFYAFHPSADDFSLKWRNRDPLLLLFFFFYRGPGFTFLFCKMLLPYFVIAKQLQLKKNDNF